MLRMAATFRWVCAPGSPASGPFYFTKFPAYPLPAAGFEFESLEVGATDLSEAYLGLCSIANNFHAGSQDSELHVFSMTSYDPQAHSPVLQAQLLGQSILQRNCKWVKGLLFQQNSHLPSVSQGRLSLPLPGSAAITWWPRCSVSLNVASGASTASLKYGRARSRTDFFLHPI